MTGCTRAFVQWTFILQGVFEEGCKPSRWILICNSSSPSGSLRRSLWLVGKEDMYLILTIERDPVSRMKRSVANRSTTLRREKLASQGRDAHARSQAHGDVWPITVWMLVAMSLTSSCMFPSPPSLLEAGRKRTNRGDGWLPPNYRETTFKDSHARKSDTDGAHRDRAGGCVQGVREVAHDETWREKPHN